MKKIVLLLIALFTAQASFAYIEEYTTSDIKSLQGKGYSQQLLQIIDTSRMLSQEVEKDYVPFYSRKRYSTNPVMKWYDVAKKFLDPAQDENIFGVREIDFNNRLFDFSPSYIEKFSPNDKYQRLLEKDIERLETAGKIVPGSNGIEEGTEENL